MSGLDFSHLREGKPGCPSDLVLDRHAAGELSREQAGATDGHVATCDTCRARMERRRAGFDAVAQGISQGIPSGIPSSIPSGIPSGIPSIDARASLARLRGKLDRPRTGAMEGLRAFVRRFWLAGAPVVLAAAAALVVMLRPHPLSPVDEPSQGGIRYKGALRLRVHRMRGSGSEEIESGAPVQGGDRLRFVVDLPAAGQVRILGVEADGSLFTAWPLEDGTESRRPAGPAQILPGAVEVDAPVQAQVLYLVHCPAAEEAPHCTARDAQSEPVCPAGCSTARFVLSPAR